MFKNYLRVAIRNLTRNKSFSFINVFGLALGTACCLYILLYVKDEFSYDKHHEDVQRIYRVTVELEAGEEVSRLATCSPIIPMTMKQDFPEVAEATRFVGMFTDKQQIFRLGEQVFYESNGAYADSTFFNVFTYNFIYGNPESALAAPFNIVLSEKTAQKFYGNIDPVGQTIEMDIGEGPQKLTVTGVFNNEYGKSHIEANFFLSMNSGGIGSYVVRADDWVGNNFTNAYIKLGQNTSSEQLQRKFPAFLQNYASEQLEKRKTKKRLALQPVTAIHTNTSFDAGPGSQVSSTMLYILLAIAGLIQLIACINFMNLSTALAARRSQEIGIRKVVGARRHALILQFLGESLIIAFLAMLVAVPMVYALIPFLNQMTGVELSPGFLMDGQIILGILALGLLTGLLAGSYPALYLSGFQPLNVLKNKASQFGGNMNLRRTLVVFQFVLAISLIISVIIINSQLQFIQHKDLGYEPDQKMVVPFRTSAALQKANSYRDAIQQIPEIQSVSRANNYPSQFVFNDMSFYKQGRSMEEAVNTKFMQVDEYFLKCLGIELLEGRDFRQTDTTGRVIVNEAMLAALDIPKESAAGQHLFSGPVDETYGVEIVGVMKNFNFNSLYSEVRPFLLLYNNSEEHQHMIIHAKTNDYGKLIGRLSSAWEGRISSVPFEYSFIDEEVQMQYKAEQRLSNIINSFTLLTVLISCLGLFGLVMFTVERRTKEIGIRKVLGASVFDIASMITKDYSKLVIIAFLVSTPISWWVMRQWLNEFAYQVDLQWWMFVLAGSLAILIAFLTVSFQSIKAALTNPVDSLRSE